MRKALLMTVLCFFLMQGVGWGETATFNTGYELYDRWIETKCEICGKTVYEWVDTDLNYYGICGSVNFSYPPGEEKKTIYLKDIIVCPVCKKKYSERFDKSISEILKRIIETENVQLLRKKHEIQRQQRQMKDLLEQVDSLGKQIDKIRKEIAR